jgi:hypothetical protein
LINEEYVFSSCACEEPGGNGGGDGSQVLTEQELIALFDAYVEGSHSTSKSISEQTIFEDAQKRKRKYDWQFHQIDDGFGPAYKFYSTEMGYQTKNPNGTWKFTSLEHSSTSQEGDAYFWTATHTIIGNPVCAVGTAFFNSWASIQFDYDINIAYTVLGFTRSKEKIFTNAKIWNSSQGITLPL